MLLQIKREAFDPIFETPIHTVAAIDRIRQYPVYIRVDRARAEVAAGTSSWIAKGDTQEIDETVVDIY